MCSTRSVPNPWLLGSLAVCIAFLPSICAQVQRLHARATPRTLVAEGAPIRAVAFAAAGGVLADAIDPGDSLSPEGTHLLALWDLGPAPVRSAPLAEHGWAGAEASPCVFSPDARLLARGGVGSIGVWSTASGEAQWTTPEAGAPMPTALAFSGEGTLLCAARGNGRVTLYLAATGACVKHLAPAHGALLGLAVTPDGRRAAAVGQQGRLILWSVATGKIERVVPTTRCPLWTVAFSPDGRLVACAGIDRMVHVYEAESGACRARLAGHTDFVDRVLFSPDGAHLASVAEDGTARIWSATSLRLEEVLPGLTACAGGAAFSPDSRRLAAGCQDGTLMCWTLRRE